MGSETYQGTHPLLITRGLYSQVQVALNGGHTSKYKKHDIAFRGLLKCAHDDCTLTGGNKKGQVRVLPLQSRAWSVRPAIFSRRANHRENGDVLRDVWRLTWLRRLRQVCNAGTRIHVYGRRTTLRVWTDPLMPSTVAWTPPIATNSTAKYPRSSGSASRQTGSSKEWAVKGQITQLEEAKGANPLPGVRRILELAQNAHSMYVNQKPAEQEELLRKVVSNCSINAVSVYPNYTYPFDLISRRVKKSRMVGERGFEPPTPWFRPNNRFTNLLSRLGLFCVLHPV